MSLSSRCIIPKRPAAATKGLEPFHDKGRRGGLSRENDVALTHPPAPAVYHRGASLGSLKTDPGPTRPHLGRLGVQAHRGSTDTPRSGHPRRHPELQQRPDDRPRRPGRRRAASSEYFRDMPVLARQLRRRVLTDGTTEAVRHASVRSDSSPARSQEQDRLPSSSSTPYDGIPGTGSAFRTVFEIGASGSASRPVRSSTPTCAASPRSGSSCCSTPVLEHGFDYVAPVYLRHKFDGTITNNDRLPRSPAPFTASEVRQPIGGDFAFSGTAGLASTLRQDVWETDVARFGIDIWMTTMAVTQEAPRSANRTWGSRSATPRTPRPTSARCSGRSS
ncbi:MAG: hypothetical protein MZV63_65920 [Marinilabiliales bacterium]|nr:hypothetical protein [Marinilabiliales bacterium]